MRNFEHMDIANGPQRVRDRVRVQLLPGEPEQEKQEKAPEVTEKVDEKAAR